MPKMPTRARLRRVQRKLNSRFSLAVPQSSMNLFLFASIPPPIFSFQIQIPSLLFSSLLRLRLSSHSPQLTTLYMALGPRPTAQPTFICFLIHSFGFTSNYSLKFIVKPRDYVKYNTHQTFNF